ncbi:MAG TPA: NifB/NifX family molybdenum-iron cluster-binding protein [Clostridia bacterium]|jgi:predicted Fe-Mo cluster-binding NifX family protein|nr:NifB/NifX family molybdenum-iron cluster-binding protein [Clostridia bacterium]
MRIALPVNDKDIKSEICPSFGRTPYFLIYDTAEKSSVFLDNLAAQSAGGAGIKAAQMLVDQSVKVIIAPRYGENAAKVLIDGDIKVYKNIVGTAEENIKAYEKNQLDILADIHPGFHNHGNK